MPSANPLGFETYWVLGVSFSEPDKEPRPTTSSDHFCALAFQMACSCTRALLSCEFWGYFTDALFLNRPGRECGSGKMKLKLKKMRS
jgi:hypothetical protein